MNIRVCGHHEAWLNPTAGVKAAGLPDPRLMQVVQCNCDLADAQHARERSLCNYLLGMREFFRWQACLPVSAPPDKLAVRAWIAERESRWEGMLSASVEHFARLPLADGIDAFDESAANRALHPCGLVYGAGIGHAHTPVFFLAQLIGQQQRDGSTIVIAGREYARGFDAPPASSRAGVIVIRTDAFRRWLGVKAEGLGRQAQADHFHRALALHEQGAGAGGAMDAMIRDEIEVLILHELGEIRAAGLLGCDWETMLSTLDNRQTEMTLRAVRDLLADALVTLPTLIDRRAIASLEFWFANLDGLRRRVAACHSDLDSFASGKPVDLRALRGLLETGIVAWRKMGEEALACWRTGQSPGVDAYARTLVAS